MEGDFGDQLPIDHDQAFSEYIDQLNRFFVPRTVPQLKKFIRVFSGEVAGDDELWTVRPSNQTFRSVVYRSEMQPDQWPKYRYLLLEVWDPSHLALKTVVAEQRAECRSEVFSALHDHYETTYCREHAKLNDQLSSSERTQIFNQAYEPYNGLLKNLEAELLDRKAMQEAVSNVPAAAATDPSPDADVEELDES